CGRTSERDQVIGSAKYICVVAGPPDPATKNHTRKHMRHENKPKQRQSEFSPGKQRAICDDAEESSNNSPLCLTAGRGPFFDAWASICQPSGGCGNEFGRQPAQQRQQHPE